MSAAGFPFKMLGGVLVVTTPAEIDITAADQLQAILFDWRVLGHTTVVVDMTGTQCCDPAGIFELALAHQRAQTVGGGLRLVIPAASAVRRVFTMTGLDRLVPCYASREDALSRAIATAVWNAHARGRATAPIREHGPSEVA
jgi:anti-anti-sigma factor